MKTAIGQALVVVSSDQSWDGELGSQCWFLFRKDRLGWETPGEASGGRGPAAVGQEEPGNEECAKTRQKLHTGITSHLLCACHGIHQCQPFKDHQAVSFPYTFVWLKMHCGWLCKVWLQFKNPLKHFGIRVPVQIRAYIPLPKQEWSRISMIVFRFSAIRSRV